MTANANPTAAAEPFLGVDWIEGYRQDRAVELLRERTDWDLDGYRELQRDVYSIPWRELREHVLGAPGADPEVVRGQSLLGGWDGKVEAGSAGAALFELWQAEMVRRVCQAKAPNSWEWAAGKGFQVLAPHSVFMVRRTGHLVRLLREQPAGWFEGGWPAEVAAALAAAVGDLERRLGPDPLRWSWGAVRPLTLLHPLGARKPLSRVFNLGPFPWGGDSNTVAQASVDPVSPSANPGFIQSLRMVVDLGRFERSRWVLPGGQSGNPLSPHYDDQLPLWLGGEGIPIAFTADEVRSATRRSLSLLPSLA